MMNFLALGPIDDTIVIFVYFYLIHVFNVRAVAFPHPYNSNTEKPVRDKTKTFTCRINIEILRVGADGEVVGAYLAAVGLAEDLDGYVTGSGTLLLGRHTAFELEGLVAVSEVRARDDALLAAVGEGRHAGSTLFDLQYYLPTPVGQFRLHAYTDLDTIAAVSLAGHHPRRDAHPLAEPPQAELHLAGHLDRVSLVLAGEVLVGARERHRELLTLEKPVLGDGKREVPARQGHQRRAVLREGGVGAVAGAEVHQRCGNVTSLNIRLAARVGGCLVVNPGNIFDHHREVPPATGLRPGEEGRQPDGVRHLLELDRRAIGVWLTGHVHLVVAESHHGIAPAVAPGT
ncbi:MAG: hypothetical protein DRN08_06350 [Thermoplasmata archaeon]|nr:MAG: hypothetical protein DRN08_06350 [Thermoplasmata archaeon]